MIFWYKDLYMDEKVRKQEKKCKKIIEERSIFQKLPWKKSFYRSLSRFYAKVMRHRKCFLRNRYLKRRIFRDRRKVM